MTICVCISVAMRLIESIDILVAQATWNSHGKVREFDVT